MARLALTVEGRVQGVGFRPFVYRQATSRGLVGWVRNAGGSVQIEVQGTRPRVDEFLHSLRAELPPPGRVDTLALEAVSELPEPDFRIVGSEPSAAPRAALSADLAPCAECRAELSSPASRRRGYAFTHCVACGPRYSITRALPFDRARTTMAPFTPCAECAREYADPGDRRLHAQTIACPRCGPALAFWQRGEARAAGADALERAIASLRGGEILALQGVGGFQLLVDATDAQAVARLRALKQREEKPLALLFRGLDALEHYAVVSPLERELLASSSAPIVLVARKQVGPHVLPLASAVAPDNPRLGVLLPSTPLHQLIAESVTRPLVCTSGNLSGEPLCIDPSEALQRLDGIADAFLLHDREIARPLDDSVAQVTASGIQLLRRARGHAPEPVAAVPSEHSLLALGGHLKTTVSLIHRGELVLGPHIGDLDSEGARARLESAIDELIELHQARPEAIACDRHPDYFTSEVARRLASALDVPLLAVQHHHAHVAAVTLEHGLSGPVLGLAWDGSGLGDDGTLWGGEALLCNGAHFERRARLLPFALPGGERAMREPRRAALGVLHALGRLDWAQRWFRPEQLAIITRAIEAGVNSPRCSSVGRLFDAVAALLELRPRPSFEGQAALDVQFLAERAPGLAPYPLALLGRAPIDIDWRPSFAALLGDLERGAEPELMAARFQATLVEAAAQIVERLAAPRVVLSGGCFQNARLSDDVRARLEALSIEVWSANRVPCNDGGLSVGQAWVALQRLEEQRPCA